MVCARFPALKKQQQQDSHESEVSLVYIVKPYNKQTQKLLTTFSLVLLTPGVELGVGMGVCISIM